MKMKKELASKYDHKSVEKGKYQNWKDKGYFLSCDETKTKFSTCRNSVGKY